MSDQQTIFRGPATVSFIDGDTFEHDNIYIFSSGWVMAMDQDRHRRYFPAQTVKMIDFN